MTTALTDEYHASFREDELRGWSDAVQYGFLNVGTRTDMTPEARQLNSNSRVWVFMRRVNQYVGVGEVDGPPVSITELPVGDMEIQLLDVLCEAKGVRVAANTWADEMVVPVTWLHATTPGWGHPGKAFCGEVNAILQPPSNGPFTWESDRRAVKSRWRMPD